MKSIHSNALYEGKKLNCALGDSSRNAYEPIGKLEWNCKNMLICDHFMNWWINNGFSASPYEEESVYIETENRTFWAREFKLNLFFSPCVTNTVWNFVYSFFGEINPQDIEHNCFEPSYTSALL